MLTPRPRPLLNVAKKVECKRWKIMHTKATIPFNMNHSVPAEKHSGATLTSALVSLLVVSGCLYSGMQLQMVSLTGGYSANNQSKASLLINNIVERMHANGAGTLAGHYKTELKSLTYQTVASNAPHDCNSNPCNTNQLATYDLQEWQARFPDSLRDISAKITNKTSDNRVWKIIIRWDEDGNGSEGKNCPPKILKADGVADQNTDLDCVALEVSFR